MVKGFDQNGHKDHYYDRGRSWKDGNDQLAGQNRGKAHQHDDRYPHLRLIRDKEQGGSWDFQESNSSIRIGNLNENNQEDQYTLARDREQRSQAYNDSRQGEGGSCKSGFGQNPDMGQYSTPPTAVRATRHNPGRKRQGRNLFQETEQNYSEGKSWSYDNYPSAEQNRGKAYEYREQHDSGYPHMRITRDKEQEGPWDCEGSSTSNKWGHHGQKSETSGYIHTIAFSTGNQKDQYTPLRNRKQRSQAYESRNGDEGGSQISDFGQNPDMDRHTPLTDIRARRHRNLGRKCQGRNLFQDTEQTMQNKETDSILQTNQLNIINQGASGIVNAARERKDVTTGLDATPSYKIQTVPDNVSESLKTPVENNSSPQDSTDGKTWGKSRTPTLSELENSVHYDCRLDKVLRVALDYALPEEIA